MGEVGMSIAKCLGYLCVMALFVPSSSLTCYKCYSGDSESECMGKNIMDTCDKGELCHWDRTDTTIDLGTGNYIHTTSYTAGCKSASICKQNYDAGHVGGPHTYRSFLKCCCTDYCTSGDSAGQGNYTNCPNVDDVPPEGDSPGSSAGVLELSILCQLVLTMCALRGAVV